MIVVGRSGTSPTCPAVFNLVAYLVVTAMEFALFIRWQSRVTKGTLSDEGLDCSNGSGFEIVVAAACLHLLLCILEILIIVRLRRNATFAP